MANILSAVLLLVRNLPTIITIAREVLNLIKEHKSAKPLSKAEIAAMEKEILDAVVKATQTKDLRDLEKLIGNTKPGAPSDLDGVVRTRREAKD